MSCLLYVELCFCDIRHIAQTQTMNHPLNNLATANLELHVVYKYVDTQKRGPLDAVALHDFREGAEASGACPIRAELPVSARSEIME